MHNGKVLWILSLGIVFFTFVTLAVVLMRPDDGQIYSLFAGILNTFVGGLMIWLNIRPREAPKEPPSQPTAKPMEPAHEVPPVR
jgi:hypothetical protein